MHEIFYKYILEMLPQIILALISFGLAGFWYVFQLNSELKTHLTIKSILYSKKFGSCSQLFF